MPKIKFDDHPEFTPNLTPREIFKRGSFGGTYWRPIYSRVTKKKYKNVHKRYPKSWWKDIPNEHMTLAWDDYDKSVNKYKVKVGTTLEFWEDSKWIDKKHPYGWVQWYCDFYRGKRSYDDERQIKRWLGIAGPNGRFNKMLLNMIKKGKDSPKIRQTLQHWAVKV